MWSGRDRQGPLQADHELPTPDTSDQLAERPSAPNGVGQEPDGIRLPRKSHANVRAGPSRVREPQLGPGLHGGLRCAGSRRTRMCPTGPRTRVKR